jgi:DNA-binding GntR family transcriptional regulator
MMEAPAFSKPFSLVQQIHQALSKAILTGELKPGTPLKESELQKWFGVSRAPIREAIRLLESEGLIVVKAFKEKYVRRLSPEELRETFTVLACLDGFAAFLAAGSMTDKVLSDLEANIDQMERANDAGDLDLCTQLNFDFHRTVVLAAGNSVLKRSIASIMKRSGWYWLTRIFFSNPALIQNAIADHTSILNVLRTRDAEGAERAARFHGFNILSNWTDQMESVE